MSVEHQTIDEKRTPFTAGIDWASADHAVAVVDAAGVQRDRFLVPHTGTGLRQLVRRLRRAGVGEVAIERPDGPVVEALLEAELTVFVIAPNQLKNLRSRYGSAGNKDDSFDAYVLADTLRTDRARLHPLTRDSEATMTLRMTVRARQDLVAARVAMANQLRAHLQTTLPGAVGLFRDIDSAITLAFLTRFPSQDKTDWLSRTRLGNWLRSTGYNHSAKLDQLWDHLHDAPLAPAAAKPQPEPRSPWRWSPASTRYEPRSKALEEQIAIQLAQHPDAAIFTSLPRSGTVRAARLLAEIGDARGRYPTPGATHLPVRCSTFHPAIGQGQSRHLPLGRGQTTPRRPGRLRRRQSSRQPLGRRPLPTSPRPRPRPSPRRPHPGPRLAPHHLALLARRRPLRPRQTPRPATPPRHDGLTQGYYCRTE
jgi:transposase